MSEVKPIYARGFFNMSFSGETNQLTVFYYYDRDEYYASLKKIEIKNEIKKLKENMQYYLDQEEIRINGKRVKAKVMFVRFGLLSIKYPFVEFLIRFRGELKKGVNKYEDTYEEEIAEYPYEATWILPGKVINSNIAGKVRIKNNILFLKVKKGLKVGGTETIEFIT